MAIQAYVDDSTSDEGDQRLFLAGYVNRADKWALFSDAWDEELRGSPSIDYLKMRDANSLRGQFQGWTADARDKKLQGLYRVIRHFKPASIHSSVSRKEFEEIVVPVAPFGFSRPYSFCFQAIMIHLAYSTLESGLPKVPIEFIFDDQEGLGEEAKFFYRLIRDNQPKAVRDILSVDPIFRDDKLVKPLQAADMLAWHVRRNHVRDPMAFQVPDFLSTNGLHMAIDIDASHLRHLADGFAKIPGTQLLKSKPAWKKTLEQVKIIELEGKRPPNWSTRSHVAKIVWKRRALGLLRRFRVHFLE